MTVYQCLPAAVQKVFDMKDAVSGSVRTKVTQILKGSFLPAENWSSLDVVREKTISGTVRSDKRVARGLYDYMMQTTLLKYVKVIIPEALLICELESPKSSVSHYSFSRKIFDAYKFIIQLHTRDDQRADIIVKASGPNQFSGHHDTSSAKICLAVLSNLFDNLYSSSMPAICHENAIEFQQPMASFPLFCDTTRGYDDRRGEDSKDTSGKDDDDDDDGDENKFSNIIPVQLVDQASPILDSSESICFYIGGDVSGLTHHVKVGMTTDPTARFEEICRQNPSSSEGHLFLKFSPPASVQSQFCRHSRTNSSLITATGHESAMFQFLDTYFEIDVKRCVFQ